MLLSMCLTSGTFSEGAGISPWLWILILLVVVVFAVWLLTRNTFRSETDQAEQEDASPDSGEPAKTKAAFPPPFQEADDLTKIEGIGPKTSQVFQDAGIKTFQQLAEKTARELKTILDDAKLTLGDPTTWPEQARMAAEGKWDELAEYQEELKGGR